MKKIFNKVGLLLIAVVAVGMLGISYAAYTDFDRRNRPHHGQHGF